MNPKKCPHCGKMISDTARFCPYCEEILIKKTEMEPVKAVSGRKRAILLSVTAVLVLCAVIAGILLIRNNRKVNAETWYTYEGKKYHLLLRSDLDFNHLTVPQGEIVKNVVGIRSGAVPSQLYVFDEETGENAKEMFQTLIQNAEVRVESDVRSEGALAELGNPVDHPGFPQAVYETDVIFNNYVRKNRIIWTLTMKDGKKLTLTQSLDIIALTTELYDYRTTPLENGEDLQKLIRDIQENGDPAVVYTVNLGPYEYSGNFDISSHAVSLTGSRDGDRQTTFSGTLQVNTRFPYACEITGIIFEGDNSTAVIDAAGTFFIDCEFNGLDIGIQAADQGYVMPSGCIFRNCHTGILFNSKESGSKRAYFDDDQFIGCDTAILLKSVPGDDVLTFPGCVFEGNGTDIDNPAACELDLSEAEFR